MGVCQTKKLNTKLDSQRVKTESKTKIDLSGTQETELKKSLHQHQEKQANTETICIQNLDCTIPASQRGLAFTMPKLLNSPQSLNNPLLESTSASKKYTLIGQHKSNYQLQILQNNKTGMLVQMQNIPKHIEGNEKYINQLQKISIDHPNILRIIEIYQDKSNYQVISEYFNGSNLSDLIIGEAKVSKPQVAQIYEQIISAMSYLHQKNIVHGNLTLKSFQYMNLNNRLVVKLTNLKTIYCKDLTNIEVIKLLPPECLYRQEQFTKERDIWTVGLIGLILRKGKLPYEIPQNTTQQIMIQIIKDHKFNFQHKKDQKFKHFLETVLSKYPQERLDFDKLRKHEFIKFYSKKKANTKVQLLKNFLTNKPCRPIQQLMLSYFGQEFNIEEYFAAQKLYIEANTNNDGSLSKQELIKLFYNYKINKENIAQKIDDIFQQFEINDQMGMDQNKFVSLTLSRSILLTQENIETCFAIFSFNKSDIYLKGLKRHLQCETVDIKSEFASMTDDLNSLNQQQFESMMKLLK
ncbi:unnamed protein product (macronuclear) [Paramecium tetraurelia]|uniref:Protein kinase domain-containing protein n=1 Tax=Paramecium tetraurelia TaxID=5888 RepID=A0BF04_PARTE|nr:uncharacterized protein GSPATT00028156001 [Paramecium tetraurelia]CAK57121.1 unnamed protein product [Paramecium tetraurelia]|eukprot:XP_001424519.1 hypothetical protein (macronuclear) [Paramecium tetraurelia strain d4-2]